MLKLMRGRLMLRLLLILLSVALCIPAAYSANYKDIIGWHWYNELHEQKPIKPKAKSKPFDKLSSLQQLKALQKVTNELKAKAILSGNVSDIAAYKAVQDFWLKKATRFTVGWEQMLLLYPELNYALKYSHENAMASIMQQSKHKREHDAIEKLSKSYGLLYFYRSHVREDKLLSKVIHTLISEYHLKAITISEDGQSDPQFRLSQQDNHGLKAKALGVKYIPAVVLVNPASGSYRVISYGYKSEEEMKDRLLKISDGWISEF